jgi:protein-glutamine gamma-glutamyltransferase
MPTASAFRLSIYLTLALACAAIGYSESTFLIETPIIAGVVIVALAILYRLESRVELLTIPAANRLGLAVGLANVVWAAFRILREMNDPQMPRTDWPMLGLGLTGPLVLMLIPAKLARREKHAGDYWWLYGLSLAAAALAGALAEDFFAFVLIGLYALCAIWSLVLFCLSQGSGLIRPIPGQGPEVRVVGVVSGQPRDGARFALGMAALAAAVAIPLYLITPRSSFARLEFGKSRVEIGYAADQMVDLTQTGDLRANDQIAFEVYAETEKGPRLDLPLDQRWWGQTKIRYQSGRWPEGTDFRLPTIAPAPRPIVGSVTIPHLWPDETRFSFAIPRGLRYQFLTDPVTWVGNEPPPIATVTRNGYRPWLWIGNGVFSGDGRARDSTEPYRYVQAWKSEDDPDLGPAVQLIDFDLERVLRPLRFNPVQKVKEYTDTIVQRMVQSGRLPPEHFDRVTMLPRAEFHNLVARELSAHLATTPTLTYTTELRRTNKDIDPVEDFLFYTRAGHCERFATALVLMLRSQGIPAVLVLGFKGCEPTEQPGRYLVRQEHAHAWVEALIQDYQPRPWWKVWQTSRWLTLDPTPSSAPAAAAGGGWTDRATSWLRRIYSTYLIDYTPEDRIRALGSLVAAVTRWDVLGSLAAAIVLALATRAILRRRRAAYRETPARRWFDRLILVLAPHGLAPRSGETAREFALRASVALRPKPTAEVVAEIPLDWAEAYYEARFGGQVLPPERLAALESGLNRLQDALAGFGNRMGEAS